MWSATTPPDQNSPAQIVSAASDAVPSDPALPQLSQALDRSTMLHILAEALCPTVAARAQFQLCDCVIQQIRYKPSLNCLISYRVTIADSLTQQRHEHILCTKLFTAGRSLSRFLKAQQQPLVVPPFGPPLLHIPALEMVVWSFPNDRKLRALPLIVDQARLEHELLPPIIDAHVGPDWTIAALQSQLIHYVAEHTCTVRVDLRLRQVSTEAVQTLTLYGKTYSSDEGAAAYAHMQQLWHSDARRAGRQAMAQPLGYQPEQQILWQAGLSGTTLLNQHQHSAPFLRLLAQAASAVAVLHQSSVAELQVVAPADLLHRLSEAARLLSYTRPHLVERLQRLVERLGHTAPDLADRPAATLHGDLHLQNFYVTQDKIALIDLDNVCQGDPLHDLGSFIAGIVYRGLLEETADHTVQHMIDVFVQAYAQQVRWVVDERALGWYVATALISERAMRCVTRLKGGRLALVDEIVALAERISLQHASALSADEGFRYAARH